mmetsp:Transcript_37796/g.43439  ORF Transcript_37796/g.43439 Transcript_37796/m.43439 type:complete len:80 (+) Transcript_37796:429-668(+)
MGVSRNGDNWQALINYEGVKKYIGTFATEKEAAVAYDFYSIVLHCHKAKINFGYDTETVMEMAENYSHNGKLNCSMFLQ